MPKNNNQLPLKILAINPGMKELGFAVFDDWGRLQDYGIKVFKQYQSTQKRIRVCEKFVQKIFSDEQITTLVIEKISKHFVTQKKNPTHLPLLIERVKSKAISQNIPVHEFEMALVKKYICGREKPTKENMATILSQNHFPHLNRYLSSSSKHQKNYRYKMFDAIGLGLFSFFNCKQ